MGASGRHLVRRQVAEVRESVVAAFRSSDASPWLGKSRRGTLRSSEWLGAVFRFGEYWPIQKSTTSTFSRAWERLTLLTAAAA